MVDVAPSPPIDLPLEEPPPVETSPDPYPWLAVPSGVCTCGHTRDAHRGRKHGGRCLDPGCQWGRPEPRCDRYVRDPGDLLAERARAAADEPLALAMARQDQRRRRSGKTRRARRAGRWGVGPSDVRTCRKAIEYRERPPDDFVPGPEDKTAAALGTWADAEYKKLTRALYPWREVSVPIAVPGLDELAEADVYDPLIRRIEDLKARGERGWEMIGELGAFPGDVDQVMVYAYALRAAGRPVETVRVLYLRRAASGADTLTEAFDFPYDDARARAALARLHGVIDALDMGLPLPRDGRGPTLDGICRNCFARRHCWDEDEAEAAGRTPEGWRTVRDDADVERELARYVDAHERLPAREGGKVKDEVKTLLLGLSAGTYGDYVYKPARREAIWVDDVDERVAQLAEQMRQARDAGAPPPDPASLPVPQKVEIRSGRTTIERVRVAKRKNKPTTAPPADPPLLTDEPGKITKLTGPRSVSDPG